MRAHARVLLLPVTPVISGSGKCIDRAAIRLPGCPGAKCFVGGQKRAQAV
jgi:hypothetical protein